jgi:hypothetical protein
MWSEREHESQNLEVSGNLWRVKVAFCALIGWASGSVDWNLFIEGATLENIDHLAKHLRLVSFKPDHRPDQEGLKAAPDHREITDERNRRLPSSRDSTDRRISVPPRPSLRPI